MRTFIAIDVNDEVRRVSEEIVEKLMRRGFRANWVKPENVHLTLFFLGEMEEEKVEEMARHLCDRVRGFPSFSFTIKGLNFFKKGRMPRVIWLSVEKNPALSKLYEELKAELLKHSFLKDAEERFVPHITIARVKQTPEMWEKLISDISVESIVVPVSTFTIYSSTLTPEGPIYRWVYKCDFERGLMSSGGKEE